MTPLQALFHTTLQQEASLSTANAIITRLDAWGSQPAAPGTKRDPELAAILKDANALVEARETAVQAIIRDANRATYREVLCQRPRIEWEIILPFGGLAGMAGAFAYLVILMLV
jgi:hypothetical protein